MSDNSRHDTFQMAIVALLVLNLFATASALYVTLRGSTADGEQTINAKSPIYANFARVTGTPEEVLINFGHSADLGSEVTADDIPILQTVTLNLHTAKRFAAAMQATVERHEGVFGTIEN